MRFIHYTLLLLLLAAVEAPQAQIRPPTEPAGEEGARVFKGTGTTIAAPAPPAPLKGPPVDLRFEDAPVREAVAAILGDLLKVDYVVHPPLDGRVTISTASQVEPDRALFLLETALQVSGATLWRDARGVFHVGKPEALRAVAPGVRLARADQPLAPGNGAIVVQLSFIGAAEMAAILRPMLPADALLRVDSVRNLLVLSGSRSQAEGWLSLVSTFDVNLLAGMSVGVFPLRYISIKDVESALAMMSSPGTRPAAGTAGAAPEQHPLFGAIRVLPIERLNSVIVVSARSAYIEEARRWIERLDRPVHSAWEPRLHVYPVRYGSARHIGQVLSSLFGTAGAAPPPASTSGVAPGLQSVTASTSAARQPAATSTTGASPLTGAVTGRSSTTTASASPVAVDGGPRVVADELNNAILVYGTFSQFERIEEALKRLDMPPSQVLIEASIVEVTLTDELNYGLQWTFGEDRGGGSTGTSVLSKAAGGVLGGALAGFSYTVRNSAGNVRAILNALADKSLVRVISAPSLMVIDNHTAQIVVGNQQPVQSAETLSSEGNVRTTSIQYKDTGVALTVTPSIGSGDVVTMAINQAVTDVGSVDAATGQRTFLQRQINSKVAVRSGEAVVLGGLIRENSTSGSTGLPVLSEIPILGALFGAKSKTANRTELLVIITPRVARSDDDTRAISRDLKERLRSLEAVGVAPGAGETK